MAALQASGVFGRGVPLVTEIKPLGKYFPAERYHQDYYERNSKRYQFYRSLSGRDKYLTSVWGATAAEH